MTDSTARHRAAGSMWSSSGMHSCTYGGVNIIRSNNNIATVATWKGPQLRIVPSCVQAGD
eukprot:COSAG05_NODE_4093_length_1677_cov_3.778153_1_plen_60_part_00